MLVNFTVRIFNKLSDLWEGDLTQRILSNVLIVTFLLSLSATFIIELSGLSEWFHTQADLNFFFAVENAFTILLIFEVLGLIFALPNSVADSVGKQFEILSVILLRSAFKEFGHLSNPFSSQSFQMDQLYPMFADAFGALLIFLIIGLYLKKQKHESITSSDTEQNRFIRFKKVIAMALLLAYLVLGAMDITHLFQEGSYHPSFNTFYTLIIYCDVLILIYSLRYKTRYINLFRYSSFAFATVIIRLSLSAPPFYNAFLGVLAGVFVLGLTYAYNYFRVKGKKV